MPYTDLRWVSQAACTELLVDSRGEVHPEAINFFFVDAGHLLDPAVRKMCQQCPVRRECLTYAYTGVDGSGASSGYFAGFSHGQRRKNSLPQLLAVIDAEEERGEPGPKV